MRYIVIILFCGVISGCNREAVTPEEQAAREKMVRNVLENSSPRDMNDRPKVTDEFKTNFNTGWEKIFSQQAEKDEEN